MAKTTRLSIILLLVLFMLFTLCGCATLEIDLNKDGSGSAVLTISRAALSETGIETEDELKAAVDEYLKAYNTDWTIVQVKLNKVSQTDEAFILDFKLARIQNLKYVGRYELEAGKDFVENSNTRSLLKKWGQGQFETLEYANGKLVSSLAEGISIRPINYESGEAMEADAFLDSCLAGADLKIFTFLNYDVEFIEKVTLNLPGKVKYYSSENMEITNGGKTVVIYPTEFEISTLTAADGTIEKETKTASNFVGYVVYEESVSIGMIAALACLALGIGLLVFFAIKKKWLQKFLKSRGLRYLKKEYSYYLMVLPGVVMLAIFCYVPMAGIYTAFTKYDPARGIFGSEFVGLQNFINMFDPRWDFWITLRNTIIIALLKFIVGYPGSIILALLFTYLASKKFKSIMQTVSYLPYFLSWVMISGIAYNFLTTNNGILNNLLQMFGKSPIKWYSDPSHWWTILTLTSVWKGVGYGTIVFLAGICGINSELYEAASIDGAGAWRQIFTVTLPGLMPVISFTFILNMGNLIKDDYEQILALCGENNAYLKDKVSVLGTAIFGSLSSVDQYSSGAAMGLFQSVISLILIIGANRLLVKRDHPGLW